MKMNISGSACNGFSWEFSNENEYKRLYAEESILFHTWIFSFYLYFQKGVKTNCPYTFLYLNVIKLIKESIHSISISSCKIRIR